MNTVAQGSRSPAKFFLLAFELDLTRLGGQFMFTPMNYERHALAHPRREAREAIMHADRNHAVRRLRYDSDRGAQRFSVR